MMRAWLWFLLSCKRYVKRLSFLFILLVLPLAVRGIRAAEESGQTEVRVAVFAEETENAESGSEGSLESLELPLEQALAQRLAEGGPGQSEALIKFYLCESEQQVKDEVASRRAECGYVIGQDLRDKLQKKNYKRSIRVYSAPSTVAAGLSTEVVFAALMELYDQELFAGYVKNGALFDEAAPAGSPQREEMAAQAAKLYETWLYNGSTFHFVSETADAELSEGETAGKDAAGETGGESGGADSVFPVRGIAAVYIFIIGLYAAVMSLTDEKKGLFLAVPYNCRTACRISSMAAPVFLAAASGMAALWSGGVASGLLGVPGKSGMPGELPAMLLYVAAVTAFAWVLRVAIKNPEAICCLIPFFLIGSLLFCPVIIDASRYFPAAGYVQKLFLPWYYLKYFG